MSGWIKLYRKINKTSLYPKNRAFTKFEAWIDLLLLVNHSEEEILIKNEVYLCKRGQSVRSIETYQLRWSWTRQQVRSFLTLLQKQSMIELNTTTKTTILTVCNYDNYQSEQPTNNQRITNEQPTDNQRITINKNDKNNKNEKNEKNDKNKECIFNFKKSLLELGVEKQIVDDWLKVRKTKKATNSETAFNSITKQIELSGLTANECVKISVENSWSGFKAEWLKANGLNGKSDGKSDGKTPTEERIRRLSELMKKNGTDKN